MRGTISDAIGILWSCACVTQYEYTNAPLQDGNWNFRTVEWVLPFLGLIVFCGSGYRCCSGSFIAWGCRSMSLSHLDSWISLQIKIKKVKMTLAFEAKNLQCVECCIKRCSPLDDAARRCLMIGMMLQLWSCSRCVGFLLKCDVDDLMIIFSQ